MTYGSLGLVWLVKYGPRSADSVSCLRGREEPTVSLEKTSCPGQGPPTQEVAVKHLWSEATLQALWWASIKMRGSLAALFRAPTKLYFTSQSHFSFSIADRPGLGAEHRYRRCLELWGSSIEGTSLVSCRPDPNLHRCCILNNYVSRKRTVQKLEVLSRRISGGVLG